MSSRSLSVIVSLCAALTAAALGAWTLDAGPFAEDEKTTVKVMTFNVFYGGDDFDLEKHDWCATTNGCQETLDRVVDAIRSTDADIVGLEEGEDNTREIARQLGWHANPRTQIVSRYPLIDPPDAHGAYVLAELEPGKVVAVSSIHLPSDPYGPYAIRDGAAKAKVMALERSTRVPALTERLRRLEGVVSAGLPVFLVGDFNSPSQLDWTEAADRARMEIRYPVAWPVGRLAETAGFHDSYREAYPDPVAKPGFTWTPGGPESVKNDVHDRIDWVLAAGPAETIASEILGESGFADTDVAADPFPSDHRGVVSTFSVEPVATPVLVAVADRTRTVGDDVSVTFSAPGDEGERLAVVPAGASGEPTGVRTTGGVRYGTAKLPTAGLAPGRKAVVLLGSNGAELSRSLFWLYEPGASVSVAAGRATYRRGQPVTFTWRNAPGNRWDWVGLYRATDAGVAADGGIPDDSGDYVLFEYTRTDVEGEAQFTGTSHTGSGKWPLKPGRYELRLMVDDGYETIARSEPFAVTG